MEIVFRKYNIDGGRFCTKQLDHFSMDTRKILKKTLNFPSLCECILLANTFLSRISLASNSIEGTAIDGPAQHAVGFIALIILQGFLF